MMLLPARLLNTLRLEGSSTSHRWVLQATSVYGGGGNGDDVKPCAFPTPHPASYAHPQQPVYHGHNQDRVAGTKPEGGDGADEGEIQAPGTTIVTHSTTTTVRFLDGGYYKHTTEKSTVFEDLPLAQPLASDAGRTSAEERRAGAGPDAHCCGAAGGGASASGGRSGGGGGIGGRPHKVVIVNKRDLDAHDETKPAPSDMRRGNGEGGGLKDEEGEEEAAEEVMERKRRRLD